MSIQSLQPTPRSPSPIAREEVIALLTPALGEAPARLAVYKTCDALGFRSVELTLDDALAILDRLAKSPGLLGISARFAKMRAILLWGGR